MPFYYDHQAEKERYLRNRKNRKIESGECLLWDLYDFLYVYMCACACVKFVFYCVWSYRKLLMWVCKCVMIYASRCRTEVVSWIYLWRSVAKSSVDKIWPNDFFLCIRVCVCVCVVMVLTKERIFAYYANKSSLFSSWCKDDNNYFLC